MDTVQAVWQRDSGETEDLKVLKKVEECGKELIKWSKHSFKNVRRELEKKRKLLAKAERVAMSGGSNSQMKILEKQITTLLDWEAKMWAQRSKFNGCVMGTKTRASSTVKLHSGDNEIISKGCTMKMVYGAVTQPV